MRTKHRYPQHERLLDVFSERKQWRRQRRFEKIVERSRARVAEVRRRFGERSRIIQRLSEVAVRDLGEVKRKVVVRVPSRYSVVDDPKTAIDLVLSFARSVVTGKGLRKVVFDHARLKEYDLAANALLDIVASELAEEFRIRKSRYRLSVVGYYPTDPRVKRFIRSIGIIKHLDIKHEAPPADEVKDIRIFDARSRHYFPEVKGGLAEKRDRVVGEFVDHINSCLREYSRQLTDSARTRLAEYVAEIINNAEEHAGFVDWTIQGYLDTSVDPASCEIALFNFGRSIGESFLALPREGYTWRQIGGYIEQHRGRGLFGPAWREEDLLTVIALQPNVSTKNFSESDTRGQGTVEIIEFFQRVFEECSGYKDGARMAIVSGGTVVKFDGKYRIAKNQAGRSVIAFNANNSLEERPDSAYVQSLGDVRFPGTVISIRFPMSAASVVKESEDGKQDSRG